MPDSSYRKDPSLVLWCSISAGRQGHMQLEHESQTRVFIPNDYCLTQPWQGEFHLSPILKFCKGQFWLDLAEEICFKEQHCQGRSSGQRLDEGVVGMFSAFVTLLVGKHSRTTTTRCQRVSKWLMDRTSPTGWGHGQTLFRF